MTLHCCCCCCFLCVLTPRLCTRTQRGARTRARTTEHKRTVVVVVVVCDCVFVGRGSPPVFVWFFFYFLWFPSLLVYCSGVRLSFFLFLATLPSGNVCGERGATKKMSLSRPPREREKKSAKKRRHHEEETRNVSHVGKTEPSTASRTTSPKEGQLAATKRRAFTTVASRFGFHRNVSFILLVFVVSKSERRRKKNTGAQKKKQK